MKDNKPKILIVEPAPGLFNSWILEQLGSTHEVIVIPVEQIKKVTDEYIDIYNEPPKFIEPIPPIELKPLQPYYRRYERHSHKLKVKR